MVSLIIIGKCKSKHWNSLIKEILLDKNSRIREQNLMIKRKSKKLIIKMKKDYSLRVIHLNGIYLLTFLNQLKSFKPINWRHLNICYQMRLSN